MNRSVADVAVDPSLLVSFEQVFGALPDLAVRSPGRVNLIGEHTDYTQGWALPAAVNLGTIVLGRARHDRLLHVHTLLFDREDVVSLDDLDFTAGTEWARYVRGMAWMLEQGGRVLSGADLLVGGDLPIGAGLSSSASLEVAIGLALTALSGDPLQPKQLAALGCRVENEIIGVESGLMDQLAVACGVEGHALLIDCRTAAVEPVPVPRRTELLILDTGTRRTLTGSDYNRRRSECRSALTKLKAIEPRLVDLRDVTTELLDSHSGLLEPAEFRRVRHVVSENGRVLLAASALKRDDLTEFGRFMYGSHASLRDDFEVSGPELDLMVSLAAEHPAVFGARLTGAGFGGCAIALVEAGSAASIADTVAVEYLSQTGRAANTYVCRPDHGAHLIAIA